MPEQLDVVAVLGRLTVGVGGAQDERPGVQPAVALPGLVERPTEGSVRQVVQDRVAAEDIADGPPGGGLAEGAERDDLEQPVLVGAGLVVVADIADHVLGDPVGGPVHVAELELAQNRVTGPRPRLTRDAPVEHLLALGGKVPVQVVDAGTGHGWALHRPAPCVTCWR
jgi:hypothetical protein